jgi:hypothetical protein
MTDDGMSSEMMSSFSSYGLFVRSKGGSYSLMQHSIIKSRKSTRDSFSHVASSFKFMICMHVPHVVFDSSFYSCIRLDLL